MNRNQQIALQSLDYIEQAAKEDKEFQQRYRSLVNRLPIMIRESGLVAALAFLKGKAKLNEKSPEAVLLKHIEKQLKIENIHEHALTASEQDYILLQRLIQDRLVWYKRLSESKLAL